MDSGTGDPVWRSDSRVSRVAVIASLELEARILRRVLADRCGSIYVSGPGLERAGRTARRALTDGADALIAWGLAGGLSGDASGGSVMLPTRLIGESGEWRADSAWHRSLSDFIGRRMIVHEAPLYSADRVLVRPEDKTAIASRTGASAVDMESAAVAEVASDAGLPFIAVRAVADGPLDALPEGIEALVTASGRTRYEGLLPFLASPRRLRLLLQLARRSARALDALRHLATILAESGR